MNNEELNHKLDTLLVAQVLTLAKAIEAEKRAKGSSSTDNYIPDAIRLIQNQRDKILARLAQNQ